MVKYCKFSPKSSFISLIPDKGFRSFTVLGVNLRLFFVYVQRCFHDAQSSRLELTAISWYYLNILFNLSIKLTFCFLFDFQFLKSAFPLKMDNKNHMNMHPVQFACSTLAMS